MRAKTDHFTKSCDCAKIIFKKIKEKDKKTVKNI